MFDFDQKNPKPDCYQIALERSVTRAMKSAPAFAQGAPGVVILIAPAGYEINDYSDILVKLAARRTSAMSSYDGALLFVRASDTAEKIRKNFDRDMRDNDRVLVIADYGSDLPPVVTVAADKIINLPEIRAHDFRAACRATLGIELSLGQAREALSFPKELLWSAVRPGRTIQDILDRLAPHAHLAAIPAAQLDIPALSEMHGYGEAKVWGLQLALDLKAWRRGEIDWFDVDRGIVLSGPPGVGKTVFAKALAQQCGAHLVATSAAQWQASGGGYLGDLLKAMRKAFSDARAKAPSILFIDELDSVGDRAHFGHENKSYSVQVVNALLESLDGLGDRQGVIVVGATNEVSRIDPALLRAGRLDRHVVIPKPTALERLAIVESMAGLTIREGSRQSFILATEGLTGADLAKVIRDARRRARNERRALASDDILFSLPELSTPPPEYLRMVAIHETGHTLVGKLLGCGEFSGTAIFDQFPTTASGFHSGFAQFVMPPFLIQNRGVILNQIAMLLAGLAAEELWLGSFANGAGGSGTSDLAVATRLATLMESSLGMGATLRYSAAENDDELEILRQGDPALRRGIDDVLKQQFDRAKELLTQHRQLGNQVIGELLCHKWLSPERLQILLDDNAVYDVNENVDTLCA